MNLRAYFERIGYHGPAEATLDVLRALQLAHVQKIPFENLDVVRGLTIDIAPAAVERKLVDARRGGYCFEQNTLLISVLREIGFNASPLLGRVRRNVPDEVRTGLTHMCVKIDIEGVEWLADVGFGSIGPTAPLRLIVDEEQKTPHEPRRLVRHGRGLMHQVRLGEEWHDVYEFTLDAPANVDLELGNWYSCTHPKANFVNNVIVARVDGEKRLILSNREFLTRHQDGRAERREIATPGELLETLDRHFGLSFPKDTIFRAPQLTWDSESPPS